MNKKYKGWPFPEPSVETKVSTKVEAKVETNKGPWPFPKSPPIASSILLYDPEASISFGLDYEPFTFISKEAEKPSSWPRPTEILKTKTPFREADPSGVDLNVPGAKADAGKNRVYLCLQGFANALEKVSEVTTVGAEKYSPNGWKQVPNGYDRYMDAFGRHLLKYGKGEKLDTGNGGTGCYHMAQMIWNLLAAFELELESE